MKIQELDIKGPLLIQPDIFSDERGYFFESFNESKFNDLGIPNNFVQDNQSMSSKNVLRGLHFQNAPYEQGKLVRVVSGAVLDVIVDIRIDSPTFGQNYKVRLDESNKLILWIPAGFAHGFLALEDNTIFFYKCTGFYNKQSESGIIWNDKDLSIDWGVENPIVSDKDEELQTFQEFKSQFIGLYQS